MGICKYCNNPAGFLKDKHKECETKYSEGKSEIIKLVGESLKKDINLKEVQQNLKDIANASFIKEKEFLDLIKRGWHSAIDCAFEDGVLDKEEEKKLADMIDIFGFNKDQLNYDFYYQKIVKGVILREILEGIIPQHMTISGELPFNFLKTEKLIWVFKGIKYCETKTFRQYQGGYGGVSIRVMRGLYYRTGTFKGNPVDTTQLVHVDTGFLGVTDKHIYFAGNIKNFRIKYENIVAFHPYGDGIGVQRDAQNAKPQVFITDDGWFTCNLIMNLAKR